MIQPEDSNQKKKKKKKKKKKLITIWSTCTLRSIALRKQAYSNIVENLPSKYEFFQIKILIFFLCLLKNIDCGYSLEPPRRGGSNEYPQSMFWAEIWKIMYTPVNPSFTI